MTDANNGSATQITADAGTPAAANGGGDQGSTANAGDPFAGLDTGTREWIGTKGYKSLADVAKAALNAESLIGRSVQRPAADAKPEDVQAFLDKVLAPYRPEKPDGYEFKLPEGLPENLPYDKDFAQKFKDIGHKLGLTTRQAAEVHDFYVKSLAGTFEAQGKATVAKAAEATAALEKVFGGATGSEPFKQAVDLASKAIGQLGGTELVDGLKAAGLISADGMILNAPIARAFHTIGRAMFSEDGMMPGSGGGASSDNPFAEGPGKGNNTLQMRAISSDRAGAIRLIQAAGFKPEDFGLKAA